MRGRRRGCRRCSTLVSTCSVGGSKWAKVRACRTSWPDESVDDNNQLIEISDRCWLRASCDFRTQRKNRRGWVGNAYVRGWRAGDGDGFRCGRWTRTYVPSRSSVAVASCSLPRDLLLTRTKHIVLGVLQLRAFVDALFASLSPRARNGTLAALGCPIRCPFALPPRACPPPSLRAPL